jgi:ferredoxin
MRLTINHDRCLKSGQCAYMQPDLFRLDDEGSPIVLVESPAGPQIDMAQDAADMCPAQAILLEG